MNFGKKIALGVNWIEFGRERKDWKKYAPMPASWRCFKI